MVLLALASTSCTGGKFILTQHRQQQILTRLLDASRSMRERGKQKKREGKQTDDI